MNRQRVELGRAERHDPAHQVGPAAAEHLGDAPAAALADDHRAPPLLATSGSSLSSSRATVAPEQSTLARMPARDGR